MKVTATLVSRVPVFSSPIRAPGLWSARVRPQPALAVIALIALSACGPSTKLPPLPPQADLCIFYNSYRYSKAAATVEELDALARHNANEAAYHEKCLLGPREKSLGPR